MQRKLGIIGTPMHIIVGKKLALQRKLGIIGFPMHILIGNSMALQRKKQERRIPMQRTTVKGKKFA